MERIRALNRYQKGILLLLIAMILIFGVVYSVVTSRVGFLYMDKILVPEKSNGNTLYSGRIKGQDCSFTVTPKKEVTFRCGDKVYGPYTAREDPTAIPKENEFGTRMTGVEIRKGDEIIFRGGVLQTGVSDSWWILVNEDGTDASMTITAVMSDGTVIDENGNVVDPMEPSVSTVLELMDGPELTSKGYWIAWFSGVLISMVTAATVLFADELFYWGLSFRVRYIDYAEPSDWEIFGRYISWTLLTVMALVVYIIGLQYYG